MACVVIDPLDAAIGLHEEVTIIYVVHGYVASLYVMDGGRESAIGEGETVAEALDALRAKLRA